MPDSSKPLIIAHRGASHDAPENTMAAINLAWQQGAEAVEIDIQLTRDNEVVVIHDFNTKRLAGINKKVKRYFADDLRKLDVGKWKNERWKNEKIPMLREVLASVPHGKKIIIELKTGPETIAPLQKEIIASGLAAAQVELIGYDLPTMAELKKQMPDFVALWLLDLDYSPESKLSDPSLNRTLQLVADHRLDGLDVWAGQTLNQSYIDRVHRAGLKCYCWTVNDIDKARQLCEWGIDAITSDRASWLQKTLKTVKNP